MSSRRLLIKLFRFRRYAINPLWKIKRSWKEGSCHFRVPKSLGKVIKTFLTGEQ